jgi:hypothetical protein
VPNEHFAHRLSRSVNLSLFQLVSEMNPNNESLTLTRLLTTKKDGVAVVLQTMIVLRGLNMDNKDWRRNLLDEK